MFHAAPIMMMPPLLEPAALLSCTVVLSIASMKDIAARTLPNWACFTVSVIGLALRGFDGTLLASFGVATLVFGLLLACWRRGWLGGGDVKLLSACTLLVPPDQVFNLVLATTLAGGVLATIYLGLRRAVPPPSRRAQHARASMLERVLRVECWRINRRGSLPYGCAIAAAALFMLASPA